MGLYDDLNRAGLLAIALIPEWVDQTTYTNAPSSVADGVYLQASPSAQVHVAARELVHRREARLVIGTYDLTTTVYTVTINGNAVVYDASVELPASNAALRQGIADKINADGTVGPLVTASDDDANTSDAILIVGDSEADYSFDATVTGGAGTLSSLTAAATGFDVRVYVLPGGIVKSGSTGNPSGWVLPADAIYAGNSWRGFAERLDVAGLDRLYVEAYNLTKHASDGGSVVATLARVMVGPAVLEASS